MEDAVSESAPRPHYNWQTIPVRESRKGIMQCVFRGNDVLIGYSELHPHLDIASINCDLIQLIDPCISRSRCFRTAASTPTRAARVQSGMAVERLRLIVVALDRDRLGAWMEAGAATRALIYSGGSPFEAASVSTALVLDGTRPIRPSYSACRGRS
jgi:hypothetical protein